MVSVEVCAQLSRRESQLLIKQKGKVSHAMYMAILSIAELSCLSSKRSVSRR